MSECRWCDACDRPFSALDDDSRRINIEEPEIVNGVRRGTATVQRDQCGACMRQQAARVRERQAARELTEHGHTGEHGTEASSRGSKSRPDRADMSAKEEPRERSDLRVSGR